MRRFQLHRDHDVSGVSGTGVVAEGVAFTDGTVAMNWLGPRSSKVLHESVENVVGIHGHEGNTRLVWIDPGPGDREDHSPTAGERFLTRLEEASRNPLLLKAVQQVRREDVDRQCVWSTPPKCPKGPHRGPQGPNEDIAQCPTCLSPTFAMRPEGETFGEHLSDCSLPLRHQGYCKPGGNGHEPSRKVRGFPGTPAGRPR